jgi:sialic acid synthase SpsE
VAATKLPIIFSAGIGTDILQVRGILDIIRDVNPRARVDILHCNSAYPTPFSDIKLGQMKLLMKVFGEEVNAIGLSDHTEGILIPPIAVALGAQVIEKHYTLDRMMKGPDHPFAIEPDELKQMVANIRIAETVMGVKRGRPSKSEQDNNMTMALRSLVLTKAIAKGELITPAHITTKRPQPPNAIPASELDHFLSYIHHATHDMNADHILTRDDVTSPYGG